MIMTNKKTIGIGSLSIVLVMIALLWSCNIHFWDNLCVGDYILTEFNLPAWSKGSSGMHYTVWYSLLALIPAFILGKKYEKHLFAVSGKWISGFIAGYLVLSSFLFISI